MEEPGSVLGWVQEVEIVVEGSEREDVAPWVFVDRSGTGVDGPARIE